MDHIRLSRVYSRIMTTTRSPWKKRIVESTGRNTYMKTFLLGCMETNFLTTFLTPNDIDNRYGVLSLYKYDNIYLFSTSKRGMLNRIYRNLLPFFRNAEWMTMFKLNEASLLTEWFWMRSVSCICVLYL